jgi:hypothetical protein
MGQGGTGISLYHIYPPSTPCFSAFSAPQTGATLGFRDFRVLQRLYIAILESHLSHLGNKPLIMNRKQVGQVGGTGGGTGVPAFLEILEMAEATETVS